MSAERMKEADSAHRDFWQELLPGYAVFEKERRVPQIRVEKGRYVAK